VQASAFEGVLECAKSQFWELSPGSVIGSLHFRVRASADQQAVLHHVRRCFATQPPVLAQLTVQIECENWSVQ
jgi:Co/Zn/Cd efflux system component